MLFISYAVPFIEVNSRNKKENKMFSILEKKNHLPSFCLNMIRRREREKEREREKRKRERWGER